ncbi:aldehyde dehydrogenase [Mycolicibacterium chubuense]|uniref:1-pyrroline-5-carboxylate dehydrogenase n=1 Tax=Mycolicibacterium chubuense TaxID=1800 RepID=A0A0J6WCL2_MYCCU|nr:aldehyde dehydrogenase family protein [Mycolicibacterium chubuense]KMO80970.1 1-pyrroline-5-carboxylate dehydrogenase [Mycolicibacterium chubuense]ORA47321.1 aldehyde dehydrogenase [Mycolicibacterium chubuense]SPY00871.1 NAD-dependent aldehyde dehydrogenase [Mycolicibacterium chubuense]
MTTEASFDTTALDQALDELRADASAWVALPLKDKVALLDGLPQKILDLSPQMAAAANKAKGIDPTSSWAGEEWLVNVWAFVQGVMSHALVLKRILAGKAPVPPGAVHTRPDGQVVVDVFPVTAYDRLLLNGYGAQVWIEPGFTAAQTRKDAARMYRGAGYEQPGVALVLGAGNVGAITTLDVLDQLFARGNVCVVKMNPVNDYLGSFYEEIFGEFVSGGWLRFVYGNADVGGYLAHHPKVDSVHMTGSATTYDAIVWGDDAEAAARKAANTPILNKPISAELGGITPVIVVPGEWSDADMRFQAEHIATSKLNNAGHNCVATQIVVISRDWPLADKLVAEVRRVMREVEPRRTYYPHSEDKTDKACAGMSGVAFLSSDKSRAIIADLDPHSAASILRDEVFAGVLGIVRLPGATAREFLSNAVEFANDVLPGTLGASLIIDPATRKANAAAFDEAISRMRYGDIGVNVWSGLNFLLGYTPWGPFPGQTPQNIGSGTGVVHNAFLLQHVQKTIAEIPFRPSPRALLHGEWTISPKPVFFITNKTTETTVRRLVQFLVHGNTTALPGIFASALRG